MSISISLFPINLGPLTRVLMLHVDFKKWRCRMSLLPKIPLLLYRVQEIVLSRVTIFFGPHIAVMKVHVALSNLRNSHVTKWVLGVNGHLFGIQPTPPYFKLIKTNIFHQDAHISMKKRQRVQVIPGTSS